MAHCEHWGRPGSWWTLRGNMVHCKHWGATGFNVNTEGRQGSMWTLRGDRVHGPRRGDGFTANIVKTENGIFLVSSPIYKKNRFFYLNPLWTLTSSSRIHCEHWVHATWFHCFHLRQQNRVHCDHFVETGFTVYIEWQHDSLWTLRGDRIHCEHWGESGFTDTIL